MSTTPAIRDVNNVHRRFSDFVWLRNTLAVRYPGVFVPPLPPKKTIVRLIRYLVSIFFDGALSHCLEVQ